MGQQRKEKAGQNREEYAKKALKRGGVISLKKKNGEKGNII